MRGHSRYGCVSAASWCTQALNWCGFGGCAGHGQCRAWITHYRVAKAIDVQQRRIDEICAGERGISADTAVRLGLASASTRSSG